MLFYIRGGCFMNENNERTFDLGTVLTVTSGRLFTSMDNVYDILNYLSNKEFSIPINLK